MINANNVAVSASISSGTTLNATKLIALAFLGFLLLTGCSGGSESEARKVVLEVLKDPDSAKFGKFTQIGEDLACLTVNAKNSMGGYTGDHQIFLKKISDKWVYIDSQEVSHNECIILWRKSDI